MTGIETYGIAGIGCVYLPQCYKRSTVGPLGTDQPRIPAAGEALWGWKLS